MAQIDHPDYYNWFNIECADVIEHFGYNLGAAIKYIWRNGRKDSDTQIDDLKKAIWYLNREINKINKEQQDMLLNENRGTTGEIRL